MGAFVLARYPAYECFCGLESTGNGVFADFLRVTVQH